MRDVDIAVILLYKGILTELIPTRISLASSDSISQTTHL